MKDKLLLWGEAHSFLEQTSPSILGELHLGHAEEVRGEVPSGKQAVVQIVCQRSLPWEGDLNEI